ncbi:MAG: hypothetical protein KJI69_05275 [Patescibacteria group bacterium]|nr:hypothetical protein [Patescibacteria group bacterium]
MKTLFKDIKKYLPPSEKGVFAIEHFELSEERVKREKLQAMFGGSYHEVHSLKAGKYIKLVDKSKHDIVMSDTPMELDTNDNFVKAAFGSVLIGGLGLGLILMAIQSKKEVKSILVYEKEKEIIDLIEKRLPLNKKVTILNENIYDVAPKAGFDTIYFDIWNNICSDNYEDMKLLHRKWRNKLNKDGWMSSWRFEWCRDLKQRERREDRMYSYA